MISVQSEPFDAAIELANLLREAGDAGAAVSFVGVVRGEGNEDGVTQLELQQYPGFTQGRIEQIASEARKRFGLEALTIIHRYGTLRVGEEIVFVAAAAAHRRAVFEAVDYLMDRLKTEAPFWKKEVRPSGSRWIEARESDVRDRQRWHEAQG